MPTTDAALIDRVRSYLGGKEGHQPLFALVDSAAQYKALLEALSTSRMRVSDYCEDDAYPDIDRLLVDVAHTDHAVLLLGAGESVELGCPEMLFARLKDLNPAHKVVVVCRGARMQFGRLVASDAKFNRRRRVGEASVADYTLTRLAREVPYQGACGGFRSLIKTLEDGASGDLQVRSELPLNVAREIASCYDLLKCQGKTGGVAQEALTEEQWRSYLEDECLEGHRALSWRTYLRILLTEDDDCHPYLGYMAACASTYKAFNQLFTEGILGVSVLDPDFAELYDDRRTLLMSEQVAEDVMASFVSVAQACRGEDVWRYMTDVTESERAAVIVGIGKNGSIPTSQELDAVYPDLGRYLSRYEFHCQEGAQFSEYFEEYKRQKVLNAIESAFLEVVNTRARNGERLYNGLRARNAVVEELDSDGAYLYWVDALGVEFLGFIQKVAQEMEMDIQVHIARASLPTLTSENKGFYESWKHGKHKVEELDKLKHQGIDVGQPDMKRFPVHLSQELEIVRKVLRQARCKLSAGACHKVVIASDHGASRLAVIHGSENRWIMKEPGKHSGRCCRVSEVDEQPDCAAQENGYWVLANYDRFRGGRKADIEVHGGASLEEVLVPVVELSLSDTTVRLNCLTPEISTSFKRKPEVRFFSSAPLMTPFVRLGNAECRAKHGTDSGTYIAHLDMSLTAGAYEAQVYDGDTLLGTISFTVRKESAIDNDEDFFN